MNEMSDASREILTELRRCVDRVADHMARELAAGAVLQVLGKLLQHQHVSAHIVVQGSRGAETLPISTAQYASHAGATGASSYLQLSFGEAHFVLLGPPGWEPPDELAETRR